MLVIGSQSILASFDEEDLPEMLTMSMEADVAFFEDPENEKADIALEGILVERALELHESQELVDRVISSIHALRPAA